MESWVRKDGNYSYFFGATNKPTLFSGSYNDLTDKPTISSFDGKFSSLTELPYSIFQMSINGVFNGSYFTLTDTPDLSVYQLAVNAFSGSWNDLTDKPAISTFDGSWYSLTDVPDAVWYKLPEYGNDLVHEGAVRVTTDIKINQKRIKQILLSALEIEMEFITESLPVSLIGMNSN